MMPPATIDPLALDTFLAMSQDAWLISSHYIIIIITGGPIDFNKYQWLTQGVSI